MAVSRSFTSAKQSAVHQAKTSSHFAAARGRARAQGGRRHSGWMQLFLQVGGQGLL